MVLSVIRVVPPTCLAGQENGRLDPPLLWSTPGLSGGPVVRLVEPAARAWRAMSGTAAQAGITLQATSVGDSYRWYDLQRSTFVARYVPEPTTFGCKRWDSDGNGVAELWCKKASNLATAAVPGTSNHGWGLAVDVANASGGRLAWLEAHAVSFGWSWELVPEEPWHVHYWAGDAIPAAVLAYEEGDDMTPDQAATLTRIDGRVTTMMYDLPANQWQGNETNALHAHLVGIDTRINACLKAIAEISSGNADVVAIIAAMNKALDEQQAELEAAIAAAGAEARDAVGDLAEGGAAAVRADA